MNKRIRCANADCRCRFTPNPRIKNHRYCSKDGCQRVRKKLWQRRKMANDPDYHKNQKDGQESWQARNADYWRKYRSDHPEYVERNRLLQKNRDKKRRLARLAKMDASKSELSIKSGCYYIFPVQKVDLAKMDASGQKIYLIPGG